MFEGKDIVDLAMTRINQTYVLGARVHLANQNWSGPWDCAEFVSWACFHAYKIVFAVRPPDVRTGESFSGWWFSEGRDRNSLVPVAQALATQGAILVRKPGDFNKKIGHVAISRGDGTTIEAHSARVGVAVMPNASKRDWTTGLLIPGISYTSGAVIAHSPSASTLRLTDPFSRGAKIEKAQLALKAAGVDPGPIDGVFGAATQAAVASFQAREGLLVDGEIGPETRQALGL